MTTLGLGLGAMYFMDPERGEQRRSDVRNQIMQLRSEAQNVWTQGSEDLASRAKSLRNKAGQAPSDVMQAGKEALSGSRGGMKLNMDMDRPGDRLLVMSGGGLLALYGLARGGLLGKAALLAGANYVAKGLTQKDVIGDAVSKMRGASGGKGIEFRSAVRINAPVEEVFAFWQNYENFPRFMSHLKEVRDMGDGRSHWVANGPAGVPVEWDAHVTELRPNRVIAWESVPGSDVYNAGRVRFESVDGATRVDVFLTYNPPGGVAGHAIAALFGSDPKTAMDDDLLKLKSLIEQGGENMRPGYPYRRSAGSADGGNSDMGALGDEITGRNSMAGLNGGTNPPRERKPGSDVPGAGS
ncbi:MAG: SRPBCC family protein [Nitrososphaerales archaeon]